MKELTQLGAIEAPCKEAMYALDETNPLSLYDCLIPELEAYRPMRIQKMTKSKRTANAEAQLELVEKEIELVSVRIICVLTLAHPAVCPLEKKQGAYASSRERPHANSD